MKSKKLKLGSKVWFAEAIAKLLFAKDSIEVALNNYFAANIFLDVELVMRWSEIRSIHE